MFRQTLMPVLGICVFFIIGCEEYNSPEIDNSAPSVTLSASINSSNDSILVSGITSDDKYTNRLGLYIHNTDEDSSLEYAFAYPRTKTGTYTVIRENGREDKISYLIPLVVNPSYSFSSSISISNARLIDGNYVVSIVSSDVEGLVDSKNLNLTISNGGGKNIDTTAFDNVDVWSKTLRNGGHYFSLRNLKLFKYNDLRKPERVGAIDLVFAKVRDTSFIMTPSQAKLDSVAFDSLSSSRTITLGRIAPQDTTLAKYFAIQTSTKLNAEVASGSTGNKFMLSKGAAFVFETSDGDKGYVKIRSITGSRVAMTVRYKRFYPN